MVASYLTYKLKKRNIKKSPFSYSISACLSDWIQHGIWGARTHIDCRKDSATTSIWIYIRVLFRAQKMWILKRLDWICVLIVRKVFELRLNGKGSEAQDRQCPKEVCMTIQPRPVSATMSGMVVRASQFVLVKSRNHPQTKLATRAWLLSVSTSSTYDRDTLQVFSTLKRRVVMLDLNCKISWLLVRQSQKLKCFGAFKRSSPVWDIRVLRRWRTFSKLLAVWKDLQVLCFEVREIYRSSSLKFLLARLIITSWQSSSTLLQILWFCRSTGYPWFNKLRNVRSSWEIQYRPASLGKSWKLRWFLLKCWGYRGPCGARSSTTSPANTTWT